MRNAWLQHGLLGCRRRHHGRVNLHRNSHILRTPHTQFSLKLSDSIHFLLACNAFEILNNWAPLVLSPRLHGALGRGFHIDSLTSRLCTWSSAAFGLNYHFVFPFKFSAMLMLRFTKPYIHPKPIRAHSLALRFLRIGKHNLTFTHTLKLYTLFRYNWHDWNAHTQWGR